MERRFCVRPFGYRGQAEQIGIDRSALDRELVDAREDQDIAIGEHLDIIKPGRCQRRRSIVREVLQGRIGPVDRDSHRAVSHVPVTVDRDIQGHLGAKNGCRRLGLGLDDPVEIFEVGTGPIRIFTLDADLGGQGVIVTVGRDHLQEHVVGQHAGRGNIPVRGELIHDVVSAQGIHIQPGRDPVETEIFGRGRGGLDGEIMDAAQLQARAVDLESDVAQTRDRCRVVPVIDQVFQEQVVEFGNAQVGPDHHRSRTGHAVAVDRDIQGRGAGQYPGRNLSLGQDPGIEDIFGRGLDRRAFLRQADRAHIKAGSDRVQPQQLGIGRGRQYPEIINISDTDPCLIDVSHKIICSGKHGRGIDIFYQVLEAGIGPVDRDHD